MRVSKAIASSRELVVTQTSEGHDNAGMLLPGTLSLVELAQSTAVDWFGTLGLR